MNNSKWWTNTGLLLGCFVLLSGGEVLQGYLQAREQFSLADSCIAAGINWGIWVVLALLLYPCVRWMLILRIGTWWHLFFHLPLSALIVVSYIASNAWLSVYRDSLADNGGLYGFEDAFNYLLVNQMTSLLSIYTGIVAACYAFQYYRPALHASQLEVRLARAKLQALQMQLQPHFLFNTLNSISVLVHRDPDLADKMVTRLSELLRLTLASGDQQYVSLKDELSLLEKYIDIELIRFQDRLSVSKFIGEDVLKARVPSMILQPLVENAIKHGISRRAAASKITIRAFRDGGFLALEVMDDGPGLQGESQDSVIGRGVGLINCQQRLRQLFGDQQKFELQSYDDFGLTVSIRLPIDVNSVNVQKS